MGTTTRTRILVLALVAGGSLAGAMAKASPNQQVGSEAGESGALHFGNAAEKPSIPTVSRPSSRTLGELDQLNSEITLLQKRLKIAQLQGQIARQAGSTGGGAPQAASSPFPGYGELGGSGIVPGAGLAGGSAPGAGSLPQVLQLSGFEGRYSAVIRLPGGGTVQANGGMPLPGGWRIVSVSGSGVRASYADGKAVMLPFAGGAADDLSETAMASPATAGPSAAIPGAIPPFGLQEARPPVSLASPQLTGLAPLTAPKAAERGSQAGIAFGDGMAPGGSSD